MIYILNARGNNTHLRKKVFEKCTRLIFADSPTLPLTSMVSLSKTPNPNHKLCEIISFNRPGPYAIAIGANPAKGKKNYFDKTNLVVAKEIYSKKKQSGDYQYGGYILFNLYTILSSSVEKIITYIDNSNDKLNDFSTALCFLLSQSSDDIYVFWGPKMKGNNKRKRNLIQNSVSTLISSIVNNNTNMVYYSADAKGDHVHPCDSNFTQFIQLTSNNLSQVR